MANATRDTLNTESSAFVYCGFRILVPIPFPKITLFPMYKARLRQEGCVIEVKRECALCKVESLEMRAEEPWEILGWAS